jgi:hypothetical protein
MLAPLTDDVYFVDSYEDQMLLKDLILQDLFLEFI